VEEVKEVRQVEEKSADLTTAYLIGERLQDGCQLREEAESWWAIHRLKSVPL